MHGVAYIPNKVLMLATTHALLWHGREKVAAAPQLQAHFPQRLRHPQVSTHSEGAVKHKVLVVLAPGLVVGLVGRFQLRQQVAHLQPLAHVAVLVHVDGLDALVVRKDGGMVLILGLALPNDHAAGAVPARCEGQ